MKIVVVEDSPLVSTQICRVLQQEERFHILGVATEEAQAITLILATNPDAVLLDLSLSPGSGLAVLRRMRQSGIGSRVFVLTNNTEQALRQECEALGISGFYDKSAAAQDCFDRLRALLPPLPANEAARLRVLDETRLLDAPEQEAFDAIACLARDLTESPIALVSLVDRDRQWFLSHPGLQARETSRSVAVCAHAIQGTELMEVGDLRSDARFADNPLVQGELQLRFYAGVPLVVPSGEVLGTLCVLDTVARSLTPRQGAALKTLAQCVVAEMELRRRMNGLEHEVALRRAAEERVTALATRDMLTQLPNRMALHDRLEQQVRLAHREGSRFAFLFIDMDRFKQINDGLGHDAGDQALVEVARRISATLRQSDTVARLGGDEFAAIVGNIRDAQDAAVLARKINAALKQPAVLKDTDTHYDASIGIAVYPDHGGSVDELMRRADLAMYQAKAAGGGCSVVFTPELEEDASQLTALEAELDQALQRGEITAWYQPQLSLDGRSITGMEALARWQHPRLGLLAPDAFIAFAESRNIVHRIGAHMVELALAQLARWDAEGREVPRVAVNLSGGEMREGLADWMQDALRRHGIAPQRLEIEITETVLSPLSPGILAMVQRLRRLGVRVSMDHYGSGPSSLGQLRQMAVDTLKIDRSFVGELAANQADRAIVGAMIRMAHSVGLRVVAEGVESQEQLNLLRSMGCDNVQGFVHAHPMPPKAFAQWMDTLPLRTLRQGMRPRIAVLEDVPDMARLIAVMLDGCGHEVDVFGSGQAFLQSVDPYSHRMAVIDLGLPDIDFMALLDQAAQQFGQTGLLLISGHAEAVLEAAARHAGERGCKVLGTLRKPFQATGLRQALGLAAAAQTGAP